MPGCIVAFSHKEGGEAPRVHSCNISSFCQIVGVAFGTAGPVLTVLLRRVPLSILLHVLFSSAS